jgi:hypothetical protein
VPAIQSQSQVAVAASQAKEIRHYYILFTCMMDVAATAHKNENEIKSNQIKSFESEAVMDGQWRFD